MATLQRIRNHSVALLVIVGLAMLAFIIGDLLTSSNSIMQSHRDKVVTINGKKVTYEEFESARNNMAELQKTLFGQSNLTNEATQQISQQIYNEFVSETLMDEVSDKIGFAVTTDEMTELTQGDHVSPILTQIFTNPNTGQYMSNAVEFWVNLVVNNSFDETAEQYRSQGAEFPAWATMSNWLILENEIKLSRKIEKYNSFVTAAVTPNKLETKDQFDNGNKECSFAYVKKNAREVADSLVNVSKSQVEARYEATKYQYKQDATRNIEFIAVNLVPSRADYENAAAEMEAAKSEFSTTENISDFVNGNSTVPYVDAFLALSSYEADIQAFVKNGNVNDIMQPARKGNVYAMSRIMAKTTAPDSLKISVIPAASVAQADSIEGVLKSNKNFAEVAKSTITDAQLASKGGDMGWMREIEATRFFGTEICKQIFSHKVGDTFRIEIPGQTSTYIIAKVTEATAPIEKAKVATYAEEVTPSSATRRDLYGELNNFLTENKTIQAMRDSAASAGFRMLPTTLASTSYTIGNVKDARQVVRFAFQNEIGSISEIFECDDKLIVVGITGASDAGYLTLKDSLLYKNLVRTITPEVKAEYAANEMKNLGATTLEDYAAKMNASIDTAKFVDMNTRNISGIGVEPKFVGAALTAAANTVTGPVAGRNNTIVFKVTNVREKGLTYDEEAAKQALMNTQSYGAIRNALNVLMNNAEIDDNRISFY